MRLCEHRFGANPRRQPLTLPRWTVGDDSFPSFSACAFPWRGQLPHCRHGRHLPPRHADHHHHHRDASCDACHACALISRAPCSRDRPPTRRASVWTRPAARGARRTRRDETARWTRPHRRGHRNHRHGRAGAAGLVATATAAAGETILGASGRETRRTVRRRGVACARRCRSRPPRPLGQCHDADADHRTDLLLRHRLAHA